MPAKVGERIEFFGIIDSDGIERKPDGSRVPKNHPHYGHTAEVVFVDAYETGYRCNCGREWTVLVEGR